MPQPHNIPNTPEDRKEWLKNLANRNTVLNGGAGAVYFYGDKTDPKKLEVMVTHRHKDVGEGLANFGGLREDEDIVKGKPLQTALNNVEREGEEELEEILGFKPDLKQDQFTYLYTTHDDVFFTNHGKGFAIDAYLFCYAMDDKLYTNLFPNGEKESLRVDNANQEEETVKTERMPLYDALKLGDKYKYPHEYFSLWVMTAKVLKLDVVKLAKELGTDFTHIAKQMDVSVSKLEEFLGNTYKGKLDNNSNTNSRSVNDKKNTPNL